MYLLRHCDHRGDGVIHRLFSFGALVTEITKISNAM